VLSSPVSLDLERRSLVGAALRLSCFTIVWNGVLGLAALLVGLMIGSLALAGFALNALLDSSASLVLVWRFRRERREPVAAERLERRAQRWIVVAMVAVALFVGFEAVRALFDGTHSESSAVAVGIATISLLVLPPLGIMKLRLAVRLRSRALRGDGVLTIVAAGLAVVTLMALLTSSILGWWWTDPVAALIIAMRARPTRLHRRKTLQIRLFSPVAGSARDAQITGGLVRLSRQQNMLICRMFSTGADGTRTRDLRRDRPVLVVPG